MYSSLTEFALQILWSVAAEQRFFCVIGNCDNVVLVSQESRSDSWSDCRWAITFLSAHDKGTPHRIDSKTG